MDYSAHGKLVANVMPATTAHEAYDLYRHAFEADGLIQSRWRLTASDGRQLTCALGVLGEDVSSARDCPAQIMPPWLAQMVVGLFDNQDFADAKDWGLRLYAELDRVGGIVPFSVVHDWQANVVGPLAIETALKRERSTEPHEKLQALHRKALAGGAATRTEWYAALHPALYNAYADANANAYAYADAKAIADADANAYAIAYAIARKAAWKRLADGIVDSLARLPGSTGEAA